MLSLLVSLAIAPTAEAVGPPVGCLRDLSVLGIAMAPDAVRPLVIVQKEARRIQLFERNQPFLLDGEPACWQIGLGGNPIGDKLVRGDNRTPEGWYRTSDKPWSNFYGAIAVHYPNSADALRGQEAGLLSTDQGLQITRATTAGKKPPQTTRMGGEILIHGGGGRSDWTLGCIAMEDDDLDLLRAALPGDKDVDLLILS
jgi:murein L,D-transpeptidase YafK